MKRTISIFFLMIPVFSWAGEYFLIDQAKFIHQKDDIKQLCSSLVENFNRYKDEPPMVCVRKFDTKLLGISFPEWESVDVDSSIEDLRRLYEEQGKGEYFDGVYERWKDGRVSAWKSEFDINHEGLTNIVYQSRSVKLKFECDDRNGNQGNHEGAIRVRYLVEQNVKNDFESGFKRINGHVIGDLFLFRDRAYFHSWTEGSYLETGKSKEYEWPFPRILIRQVGYMFGFEESFFASPACEIGYRQ